MIFDDYPYKQPYKIGNIIVKFLAKQISRNQFFLSMLSYIYLNRYVRVRNKKFWKLFPSKNKRRTKINVIFVDDNLGFWAIQKPHEKVKIKLNFTKSGFIRKLPTQLIHKIDSM
jgi:hypothetical protein